MKPIYEIVKPKGVKNPPTTDDLRATVSSLRSALMLVLDQCDYTQNNCSPTAMVSAVLSREVIQIAEDAVVKSKGLA